MTHGQPRTGTREHATRAWARGTPVQPPGTPGQAPGTRARASGTRGPDYARAQRLARTVLAALLLVLIAAGIRAADPSVIKHGPLHKDGRPLGLALEVVLIALLIATSRYRARFSRYRARFPEPPPHLPYALNSMLQVVLWLGVICLPVAALLDSVHPLHIRPAKRGPQPGKVKKPAPPSSSSSIGRHEIAIAGHLLLIVLVIALVVAVAVCIVLIRRWRRPPRAAGYDAVPDDDFAGELRRAVESGRAALGEIDDARSAIIACYVAMEASLAEAGAVRAAAETPDELLARASSGGLVRRGAAGRLTELFYAARFSARALPQAHRASAQQALAELAAELGGALRTALANRTDAGAQPAPPADVGAQPAPPADPGKAEA